MDNVQSEEQAREFTGIWIPAVIINDPELTPIDLIVYAQVASFNCCIASNAYIAKLAHASVRSVQYTIKRLEAKGYIRIEGTRSKAGMVKRKIFAMGVENYAKQAQSGMQNLHEGVQDLHEGVQDLHGGYAKSARNNKEYNKEYNNVLDKSNTLRNADNSLPQKTEQKQEYGNPAINALFDAWQNSLGVPITSKVTKNRYSAQRLLKRYGEENLIKLIALAGKASTAQYAPQIANFMDLEEKMPNLLLWAKKKAAQGARVASAEPTTEYEVSEDF